MKKITAPFRWAGSKAKLTSALFEHFKYTDVYIEPFLGSAVVLFRLIQDGKYKHYIVNDINIGIYSFYRTLQMVPEHAIKILNETCDWYNSMTMEEKELNYYKTRKQYNIDKMTFNDYDLKHANRYWIRFWFLMKTGFNGLYRENSKGEFNVPWGKKEKISFDKQQIWDIHYLLKNVQLYCMDYKLFIEMTALRFRNDPKFIYNDPPYCNSQKYTKDNFDNSELAQYLKKLKIDAAISDIDSIQSNETYKDFFKVVIQNTKRVINIACVHEVKEVLYINYMYQKQKAIKHQGGLIQMDKKYESKAIEAIKQYLMTKSETDTQLKQAIESMEDNKKSYQSMWDYIFFQAKKELRGTNGALPDDVIYGWAIHYFIETNEVINEEMGKKEIQAKPVTNTDDIEDAEECSDDECETEKPTKPKKEKVVKPVVEKPIKTVVEKPVKKSKAKVVKAPESVINQKKKLEEIQNKKFNARENDLNEGLFALNFED
ncbi:Dam family site-specific DNA-(adenine-N6)-methyltransferase [Paracholeplasma manati]|uniref:Dam family site-specific DNA-(adenine-N6)-methyltransferase n=1 Tax=Paracholeplasma manati TaxID=591373 RepID=UPI002407DAEE|nr:Dam family site-specific DNA-(adenine-N6)-methyltransferase [Paracholeplasma manati]MDG0887886.1 Dam family site-specific DNA-(adenine-N6)-methyltransferase [Paracholeplasma manati]